MDVMPKKDQRRLLRALNDAADYTKDGLSPDEALAKSAKEHQLRSPMVQRVVEAYNKANAVAYMKSAPADSRADDYPVADLSKVATIIFGIDDKQPELIIKEANYRELDRLAPMDKEAEAHTSTPHKNKVTAETIAKGLEKLGSQGRAIINRTKSRLTRMEARSKRLLTSMAMDTAGLDRRALEKTAHNLVNAFGEEAGHAIADAVNAVGENPHKYIPKLEKSAKAVLLPDTSFYKAAKELLINKDRLEGMRKEAADDAGGLSFLNNPLLNSVADLTTLTSDAKEPHLDSNTGMSGEWDAYTKDMDSRATLYDLMLNDPEISAYSPRKVRDTYNSVVETFPELAQKKSITAAILKKSLAQGGDLDIYEIKDLIGAGKDLTAINKADTTRRGELKENTRGSGGKSDKKEGGSSKIIQILANQTIA